MSDFFIIENQNGYLLDCAENSTEELVKNLSKYKLRSKVEIKDEKALVTREIDGGLESLETNLPVVITSDLRLNEPRYASLPNIMKAKKKEIIEIKANDLPVDLEPRLKILKVMSPKERGGAVKMLSNAEDLVKTLRDKEGLIK